MAWTPAPATHDTVADQAYHAGGGDYFRSGFYSFGIYSTAFSTAACTVGEVYLRPFPVPVTRAFDRIGVNVTTAATAGSGGLLRFGIYASGGGVPTTLLVDAGTISSETSGAREITINQTLTPGIWWLAVKAEVAASTLTITPVSLCTPFGYSASGTPPTTTSSMSGMFIAAASAGATLPSPAPTGVGAFSTTAARMVSLRAA